MNYKFYIRYFDKIGNKVHSEFSNHPHRSGDEVLLYPSQVQRGPKAIFLINRVILLGVDSSSGISCEQYDVFGEFTDFYRTPPQ